MKESRLLVFSAVKPIGWIVVLILALGIPAAAADNQSRIANINDSQRVKLAQSTHSFMQSATDLGRLDPNFRMERMLLILGPSDEVQPSLRSFLGGLHDKTSANYHQWLTPEKFGEKFGPSQGDVAKVVAWLQKQGFDGVKAARGRGHIEFSGNTQLVEHAFQTEMHRFQLGSKTHLANISDISIPQAMSGVVRGLNLHSFASIQPAHVGQRAVQRDPVTGLWNPASPSSFFGAGSTLLSPANFARIYDLEPVYEDGITGKGQTIAIVARSEVNLGDVEIFRQAAGLPFNDPNIIVNGLQLEQAFDFSGDEIEASLDAEWAGAVAPEATIDLVVSRTTATSDGVVLSSAYIVDNNLADIMTVSFEECEQGLGTMNSFFNNLWEQATAQGISVFVGSGDQGAAGCDPNAISPNPAQGGLAVNGLASTPFNTAVGGTQFQDANNFSQFWSEEADPRLLDVKGYIPEAVWNESGNTFGGFSFAAGGGGVSTVYTKPVWQSTSITGVPNDSARDLPDVSLSAAVHDSYLFCVSIFAPCSLTLFGDQLAMANAGAVGGTSASSPSFAGIMALVDQKLGGRQGLANYGLYALAANENFSNCNSSNRTDPSVTAPSGCIFNDVTAGNNGVPGNDTLGNNPPPGDNSGQLGYNAVLGFDPATGLGSVDGANLINAWSALALPGSKITLAATSATAIQHGTAVSFSITVAPASGSGVPTGEVGLIAQNGGSGVGLGSGTLVNGVFNTQVILPGGDYNVVAHYSGDGSFAPSDSNLVGVNVTAESSSVAITGFNQQGIPAPSPLSFGYGDPFTVGMNVTSGSGAGVPTGTVTLFEDGTLVGTLRVNSEGFTKLVNCAVDFTFCLPFGQHALTASYSGDASFTASQSQPFVYNIVQGTPVGALIEDGNVLETTIRLSFVQSFLQIPPTGTFTLTDTFNGNTTQLAPPIPVTGPGQILGVFSLATGMHSIGGQYSGDTNYLPVTFPSGPFTVPAFPGFPTQITIAPISATSLVVGQPISLQATVTSSQTSTTPTRFVDWLVADAFVTLNSTPVVNGSAILHAILPEAGPITAEYSGDSNFAPSGSAPLNVSIAKATPSIAIKINPQTVQAGDQASVTVNVIPPPRAFSPSGLVQFFDNGQPFANAQLLASVVVVPGPSTISIPARLAEGTHVFTASYTGDANYNAVPATASGSATVNVVSTLPAPAVSSNFGTVPVGSESPIQTVVVTFTAGGVPQSVRTVTQGTPSADFLMVSAGTCASATAFTAGQTCSADIVFSPVFAGLRMGAVVLADAKKNILGTANLLGVGTGPQIALDFTGTVGLAAFASPRHIATDPVSIYSAVNGLAQVIRTPFRFSVQSDQTVVASSAHGLAGADGVAIDGAGNLYVSDPVNNQVLRIPPGCPDSSCTTVVASTSNGGIQGPQGLAVDGAGDLFITDQGNNRVVEVPAGCTTSTCQVALGAGLSQPFSVAVDLAGSIYVSDTNNNRVVKIPSGCVTAGCQTTVASGLKQPHGIAVDAAGNLYIAETGGILEISSTQTGFLLPGVQLSSNTPLDVALDQAGGLYVADPTATTVSDLDRENPFIVFNGGVPVGQVSSPQNVTVENIGTAPLNLSDIVPNFNTAVDALDSTCTASSVLMPGASCILAVESAPAEPGSAGGTVVLHDNAGNQLDAQQMVQLLGTGDGQASQTINFPPLPSPVALGVPPITLQATASSGLPVSYSVTGPASVTGSSLTLLGIGSVTVTANQSGDANFAPAPPVSQTIQVETAQTINFPALPSPVVFGAPPITLQATASSGLPVSYSVTGPASVTGSSLTLLAAGSVTVTANQAGNATFAPAPPVSQTIQVEASQTINFPGLPSPVVFGAAPITLQATASSGLPVSYSVSGPASVSGSSLTLLGAGSVTVTANQSGNTSIGPAPPVSQTMTVLADPTSVSLTSSNASASLGAAVTFTAMVSTSNSLVPSGTVIFFDGSAQLATEALNSQGVAAFTTAALAAGTHVISATYTGNGNFTGVGSAPISEMIIAPDFTVAASPSSATIPAGGSATFVFTVTPVGAFNQAVNFSCSGLPAESQCSFAPSSVAPNGAPATTTLTITTTGPVASRLLMPMNRPGSLAAASFVGLIGIVGMGLGRRRYRIGRTRLVLGMMLVAGMILLGSCGGGSTSHPSGGTPAGTSTVTVGTSSGSNAHNASITLVVTN